MPRTLHRAFDLVPDVGEAIEIAIACGFERILTSGRAVSVSTGLGELERLIELANGRISIMPGGGVSLDTVDGIMAALDVGELHSSCSSTLDVTDPAIIAFGFSGSQIRHTDADVVRALKQRLLADGSTPDR
ncbi:copper homeostasis protein CutC [compost metagenome]